jgi:hypothetical protein
MRNLVKTMASGEGIEAVVIDAESIPGSSPSTPPRSRASR